MSEVGDHPWGSHGTAEQFIREDQAGSRSILKVQGNDTPMTRFHLRNAVRLALAQVVVIVFGTLGNAAAGHWSIIAGQPSVKFTQWLADYGGWFLLLPFVWRRT